MLILNVCREETVLGLDLVVVVVVVVVPYDESERYIQEHGAPTMCHNLKSEEKKAARAIISHISLLICIQDFEISTTYSLYDYR
jgi:hypothetical protein